MHAPSMGKTGAPGDLGDRRIGAFEHTFGALNAQRQRHLQRPAASAPQWAMPINSALPAAVRSPILKTRFSFEDHH
jgi:hypothetical protein